MNRMARLSAGIGVTAFALALAATPSALQAQIITGAISGHLTDQDGKPLAGVPITIVHMPSGTKTTAVTTDAGVFAVNNLRPGGPYRVTATAPQGTKSVDIPAIDTGDPYQLDFSLGEQQVIVVTANKIGGRVLKTGPSSNFSAAQIQAAPSISRDLKDLARFNPFVTVDPTNSNALICGGANNRTNSLTIDGVRQNDDFGLQANGYPTQRSPISLDVVETLGVELAPYDVNYGQFGGCTLNATTKSGSNRFHGIAFFEYTGQALQGKSFEYTDFQSGAKQSVRLGGKFSEKTYGGTLTGPIIRDHLFFTLNYEKFRRVEPSLVGPTGSNFANQVPGVSTTQADQVRQIIKNAYGYDPLGYDQSQIPTVDRKIFAKVDWNIAPGQRAAVSFQDTRGSTIQSNGNTLTGSSTSLGLLSNWVKRSNNLTVYKAQVFSDWTENFSTELSASYKKMDNPGEPLGGNQFAQFRVYLNGAASGPSIYAGTNASYQANELTTWLQQYRAKATYRAGSHRITAGFEHEALRVHDLFVQNANGAYVFNSIADLQAGLASSLAYSSAASNNKADAGFTFHTTTNTAYLQDEWSVLPSLTIKAGVRYDRYSQSDHPTENPVVVQRYGISNAANLDGKYVIQPRIGFNWKPDRTLTVYGGVGLFGGGSPTVWTANTFYNTGQVLGNVNCSRTATASAACLAALTNVNATTVATGVQGLNTASVNLGQGLINVLDKNFKPQSSWKASIGAQKSLDLGTFGNGWRLAAEYIHTKVQNAVAWVDLYAAQNPGPAAPDGRPTFLRSRDNRYDILVTDTHRGHGDQIAGTIGKRWVEGPLQGLEAQLTYTYINSKDVNPGITTVAASNYSGVATSDPNDPGLATSNYEIRSLGKLSLSYEHAFFGDNRTRITVFGQRRSGLPFSYTFDVGANANQAGDILVGENGSIASRNRQLLYVPKATNGVVTATSDPIVKYGANFDLTAFNAFLAKTKLLKYSGEIAPRNAFTSPAITTFDLRISQELPAFYPQGSKLEVYLDMINFGNLLNKKWGVIQQVPSPYVSANVSARNCQFAGVCSTTGNYYQYDTFTGRAATSFNTQSVWQMKVGARFKF